MGASVLWEKAAAEQSAAAPAAPAKTKKPEAGTEHALADALRALIGTDATITSRVEQIEAAIEAMRSAQGHTVRFQIGDAPAGPKIEGARPELAAIVRRIAAGLINVWMTGPAGSGKTSLAHQVADALGRPFTAQSFAADTSSAALIGMLDAQGVYRETAFIHAYETGGVILLDEIDAAPSEIIVTLNAALANGTLYLPRHTDHSRRAIKRHADTVIIAAANTWGTGATAQYCGRAPIDAATLDRFVGNRHAIGYDTNLERTLCPDEGTRAIVHALRQAAEMHKLRRIVSTRSVIAAAKLHAAGIDAPEILAALTTDWTAEEKTKAGAA
jgi:MoxR-like ATPase